MGYPFLSVPSLARWIWCGCQQMPLPETLAYWKANNLQHSVSTQHVHKEARFPNGRVCFTGGATSLRLPGSYTISLPASYLPARTWSPDSLGWMVWPFFKLWLQFWIMLSWTLAPGLALTYGRCCTFFSKLSAIVKSGGITPEEDCVFAMWIYAKQLE